MVLHRPIESAALIRHWLGLSLGIATGQMPSGLFSTHPPLTGRIVELRSMTGMR